MEKDGFLNASVKVGIAWVLGTVGKLTLSDMVLIATLIYTLAQLFFLLRDKWWRERAK